MKNRENNILWKGLVGAQRLIIMVSLAAVTLIIAGACILRVFGINFVGFEELATIAVFWLYMIGSSHGSYEQSQITADIMEVLLPESLGQVDCSVHPGLHLCLLGIRSGDVVSADQRQKLLFQNPHRDWTDCDSDWPDHQLLL